MWNPTGVMLIVAALGVMVVGAICLSASPAAGVGLLIAGGGLLGFLVVVNILA